MKSATAYAYSSSANLGPGFDTLGLAHDASRNKVTVTFVENSEGIELELDCPNLPSSPEKNTASLAIKKILEGTGRTGRFRISVEDGIPIGLGLGCSGASAAAAVVAVDSLLELGLSKDEKVRYAMLGETASSGTPHADNVAASIFGGLVAVESTNPMKVRPLPISGRLSFVTIVPKIRIKSKTRISRALVPKDVTMVDHIEEIRHMSLLISGLSEGNSSLIRSGMNDGIVEKARLKLFPFYPDIKKMALAHDAAGVCISGAGPSILMACDSNTDVESVIQGAASVLQKSKIDFSVYRSLPSGGAYVEEN